MPKGKLIYRSYFTFSDYTRMINPEKTAMTSLPKGLNFRSYSYTPKLRYGLTKRITLIANFPLYFKQMKNNGNTKTGIGPGDAVLALLYRFHYNKPGKFLISGLLFTKYPTGKSSHLAKEDLPLGSGTYDAGLALMPEKEFGKLDVRASVLYIFRSRNAQNSDLGNVQLFSLSTAFNFSKNFITEATILYKSSANNKTDGEIVPGSNTFMTQFIIGAQYRLAPTLLIQAAVPVTLTAKVPFQSWYDIWLGVFYLM
ncbi:MAG: transporter [Bacteroidales bacterium]|nr:transporter [Bacteroidales bacterium]